jgi:hypothetical protein
MRIKIFVDGLRFLIDWQDRELFSEDTGLEIYEFHNLSKEKTGSEMDHWLDSKKWRDSDSALIQFGQDGTGGMFCLWFYSGLVGEPAVACFGSEGTAINVADNITEFAKRLSLGDDLYLDGVWRREYPAGNIHPNFDEWINKYSPY